MADITVTATNVIPASGAQTQVVTFGETVTAGQALYKKASDGKYWKAQCDGTAEEATVAGVALNGGAANQSGIIVTSGQLNIGATLVKTTTYVLSATAGGIAPQADLVATNRIVQIGYALNTTGDLFVRIQNTGVQV